MSKLRGRNLPADKRTVADVALAVTERFPQVPTKLYIAWIDLKRNVSRLQPELKYPVAKGSERQMLKLYFHEREIVMST